MIVTTKVNMDLQQPGTIPVMEAVQNDRYCRNLELVLTSGGENWPVPETARVVVSYRKSNGKGGEYDALPDGTSAWSAMENVLTVALAPKVLTTPGPVQLSVMLLEGSEQVTAFPVLIHVQADALGRVEDAEEYFSISGFLPAPVRGAVGQIFRISSVNEKGQVTGIAAIDADILNQEDASDEELLAATYTLTPEDFIHGLWNGPLDAGSEVPYTTTDIADKFCTRKIRTTLLPKMSYCYFTTPTEYILWNNGAFVGKVSWAEISKNWQIGYEFDEVAINFSWGWDYVGTEVVVRLTVAVADFEKVLVLGDSISADYYGNYPKWVTQLIEEGFFPASTNNNSIHATGFVAEYTAEGDVDNNFLHRIEAVTEKEGYDLVVVFGGINDYIQNIPMGESGGDRTAAFVPAVDYFFSYLMENFPNARIVVLSPLRTYNVYANTAGHLQTEYADYIRQVAKQYCLPVLNLTEESGFCPFYDSFKNRWTLIPEGYEGGDGVHPNEAYQKDFLAPMIRGFLGQFA